MDFAQHTFKLYFPPTRSIIDCNYSIDDEEVLVDSRMDWVQVRGTAIVNNDGHPKQMVNVDGIKDVDLEPVHITTIPLPDGKYLHLEKPLLIIPTLSEEDFQFLAVSHEASGITAYGQTREELMDAIRSDVATIWYNYANPTRSLADDAQCIGAWWRKNARIEEYA
jgi:hypothetical protein